MRQRLNEILAATDPPASELEFQGHHTCLEFRGHHTYLNSGDTIPVSHRCLRFRNSGDTILNSGDTIPVSHRCLPEWPWVRQSAVFSGIPIAEGVFEKRCRAVCFVNIETRRLVPFVKFEDGRAIKLGAIHIESLIPKVGLEPTPPREDRILSPARPPSP